MLRQLSIFSGSDDLTLALGLLWRTAVGLERTADNALPLDTLAARIGSEAGLDALRGLAARLGIPVVLPALAAVRRLFADEQLSSKALRLHRGRNVYSAGKAALWHALWMPFRDALTIDDATRTLTEELVALRTDAGGDGVEACVALIADRLARLGFAVHRVEAAGHAPMLRAHRPARGLPGRVALYAHYDVERPERDAWRTDPWTLTEVRGRLYGVGVGDNKAPLAQRLVALQAIERTPELLWIIQGEEEIGAPLAHREMARALRGFDADLWLEENGYFDPDGTQRALAFVADEPPAAPDAPLTRWLAGCADEARRFGCHSRLEVRGLNKSVFVEGCPFRRALPPGARYLALGVNDPASRIHQPDESVPMWTFPIHRRQFERALRLGAAAS